MVSSSAPSMFLMTTSGESFSDRSTFSSSLSKHEVSSLAATMERSSFAVSTLRGSVRGNVAVPEVCLKMIISHNYESPVYRVPKDVSHPFQSPRASELRTP